MSRAIKFLSSNSPVFDGNEAVTWVVDMTSSVGDARVKNITPGVLYTFVFRQDAVGGHTFQWSDNCINPPTVNPTPNSITTANFIGNEDQMMNCNIPGGWAV